jgi:DNA-binding IclR family transcriptional regulator
MSTDTVASAERVLAVLDVLLPHFAHGLAAGQVAAAARASPSATTRALLTLERAGYAERIPETGRWRPSHRLGRAATQMLHSLEAARERAEESRRRLAGG